MEKKEKKKKKEKNTQQFQPGQSGRNVMPEARNSGASILENG